MNKHGNRGISKIIKIIVMGFTYNLEFWNINFLLNFVKIKRDHWVLNNGKEIDICWLE